MGDALSRAEDRLRQARRVLHDLRLLERWSHVGTPVVVGAVSYGLVVARDIDIEVFGDAPDIAACFAVAAEFAVHPRVQRIRFTNDLAGDNQGLYFQVRCIDDRGEEWKADTWVLRRDHPGPLSSSLTGPMQRALTAETRQAILEIKEHLAALEAVGTPRTVHSIDIYRAVLDGGVRTVAAFEQWWARERPSGLTHWRPRS